MKRGKSVIKQIFKEHFQSFWLNGQNKCPLVMRNHIYSEVMKMLGCGDISFGFIMYICVNCLKKFKIGFTCKSRFCNKCGKKYMQQWVEKQVVKLLDVPHRHCVFTIPDEYKAYFYWNRESLKDLQDMVYDVIAEFINGVNHSNRSTYKKKQEQKKGLGIWQSGMISVIHTFGRDLCFNPHVHALVPELKIMGEAIKEVAYWEYSYLRKVWQYKLINYMISKSPHKRSEYLCMYKKYSSGFYVHAKTKMRSARGAARYIGRYLSRPSIAEYRITEYDGKDVTFWYISHESKEKIVVTVSAEAFIGKLLMHTPPKYFKMVRTYGLYAGSVCNKLKNCKALLAYMKNSLQRAGKPFETLLMKAKQVTYRNLMLSTFSIDPYECNRCGGTMELWEIWQKDYGFIYQLCR